MSSADEYRVSGRLQTEALPTQKPTYPKRGNWNAYVLSYYWLLGKKLITGLGNN